MNDESLFRPPAPAGPSGESALDQPAAEAGRSRPSGRLAVVATCRSNVLEWLSSGLLTPRRAFDKYYVDGLALREDVVPVTGVPVPGGSFDVEGGIGNFPVLVELDPGVVRWLADERVGYVPTTPLTAARHIHFREDDDREEFEARVYENVFSGRVELAVSPELFEPAEDLDLDAVRSSLQNAEDGPAAEQFRSADRLAGARALGIKAAAVHRDTLEWFAATALRTTARRTPRRKLKHPSEWLELTPDLSDYRPPRNSTFDERLFRSAASVFIGHNRTDAWDAHAVLSRIDAMLAQDDAVKETDARRWAGARDRAAAVLRGDEAFTGFKARDFRAEKALLLALVRDQPADVLAWREEELQADVLDLLLAAVLVGLAHGRKALPTALRPKELDDVLAARELVDLGADPVEPSVEVREDEESLVLSVEGRDVLHATRPARTAVQLLDELDPAVPATAAALITLATSRGWHDAVATTIRARGPLQLKTVRSGLEIMAVGPVEVASELRREELRAAVLTDGDPEVRSALEELAARQLSKETAADVE